MGSRAAFSYLSIRSSTLFPIHGNPDKTDAQDADILCDQGRIRCVPRVWLAPKAVRELRLLVRLRQQWVNSRRAIKLRVGAVLRQQRVKVPDKRWSKPWLPSVAQRKELSEQARWVIEQHQRQIARLTADIASVDARMESLALEDWMVRELLGIKGSA